MSHVILPRPTLLSPILTLPKTILPACSEKLLFSHQGKVVLQPKNFHTHIMENAVLLAVPVCFLIFLIYYIKTDSISERQERDARNRASYNSDHRQRRSVNQRAGHIYEGDEFGPLGKASGMTALVCAFILGIWIAKISNFKTMGFVIGGFPIYLWYLFFVRKMGWQ